MRKYFALVFAVCGLGISSLFFIEPVHAASLTEAQVQAVVNLLQSFGADANVITKVSAVLKSETVSTSTPPCFPLFSRNLYFGLSDATTGGDVSKLQKDLGITPVTGYFGPITERALQAWQAAHGIVSSGTPATTGYGVFGPATRNAFGRCIVDPPAVQKVKLYSVSPPAVSVGDTITLTGFGFTDANKILIDGQLAASNVPIASSIAISCTTDSSCIPGIHQTLIFTLPAKSVADCELEGACAQPQHTYEPGSHTLFVRNANGDSGSLPFTIQVTSSSSVSIVGSSGYAMLPLGTHGKWSLQLGLKEATSLLYTVTWGDGTASTTVATSTPNSATPYPWSPAFIHAYQTSGTFYPVITVSAQGGSSVSKNFTVNVSSSAGKDGAACGGFVMNPPLCAPGYHCGPADRVPDTGGVCKPN